MDYSRLFGKELDSFHRSQQIAHHPDKNGDPELFIQANEAYKRQKYSYSIDPIVLEGLPVDFQVGSGEICSVYYQKNNLFTKVPKHPSSSDLLEHEYNILNKLYSHPESMAVPYPIDLANITFSGVRKAVTTYQGCFTYDMIDLLGLMHLFDGHIPYQHIHWIIRKVVKVLQQAQSLGISHNQINPRHIIIFPKDHNIMLIDWTNATFQNNKLNYLNNSFNYLPKSVEGNYSRDLKSLIGLMTWLNMEDIDFINLFNTTNFEDILSHTKSYLSKKYGISYHELKVPGK